MCWFIFCLHVDCRTQTKAGRLAQSRTVLRPAERTGADPTEHDAGCRANADSAAIAQQSELLHAPGTDADNRYKINSTCVSSWVLFRPAVSIQMCFMKCLKFLKLRCMAFLWPSWEICIIFVLRKNKIHFFPACFYTFLCFFVAFRLFFTAIFFTIPACLYNFLNQVSK